MDVILIDPPYKSLKGVMAEFAYPMGLVELAASLRSAGISVGVLSTDLLLEVPPTAVYDFDLSRYAEGQRAYAEIVDEPGHVIWERLEARLRDLGPRLVGITALTPAIDSVLRTASVVRRAVPDATLVAGGHHASFCADELLETGLFDLVIRGEGEIPLQALATSVLAGTGVPTDLPGASYRRSDGPVHNPPPALLPDLDALPFPARDLVLDCDYSTYTGHLAGTARGCPYDCSFCSDRRLWGGRVRRRSVESVLEELASLEDLGAVTSLDFVDGTFTFDRRWLLEFCRGWSEAGLNLPWRCTARYDNMDAEVLSAMKDAGCVGLYFGLESGSQDVLDAAGKRTTIEGILSTARLVRASGIPSITSILLGLPEETEEDIERTLAFMGEVETDVFDINCYVPLPGTRYHEDGGHQAVDWKRVGYKSFDNHFSPNVSREALRGYLERAYAIAAERMAEFQARRAGN
jgi:anaerobic magnesium-protoporphyrin IX monomethyl ester cyclase